MINVWTVAVPLVTTGLSVRRYVVFKGGRYISLASSVLPPHAKTLQVHKTTLSLLGPCAVGQLGDITDSSGAFNCFLGKGEEERWKKDPGRADS